MKSNITSTLVVPHRYDSALVGQHLGNRKKIDLQVNKLLKEGKVQESNSPFGFPSGFGRKKRCAIIVN